MWCMQLEQHTTSCGSGNSLFTGWGVGDILLGRSLGCVEPSGVSSPKGRGVSSSRSGSLTLPGPVCERRDESYRSGDYVCGRAGVLARLSLRGLAVVYLRGYLVGVTPGQNTLPNTLPDARHQGRYRGADASS